MNEVRGSSNNNSKSSFLSHPLHFLCHFFLHLPKTHAEHAESWVEGGKSILPIFHSIKIMNLHTRMRMNGGIESHLHQNQFFWHFYSLTYTNIQFNKSLVVAISLSFNSSTFTRINRKEVEVKESRIAFTAWLMSWTISYEQIKIQHRIELEVKST